MPTAGKLAAALLFAALAWYASQLIKPKFPEAFDPGWFAEVNAAVGLILGWRLAGPRAGTGYTDAIGYGLTTIIAITFVALFLHCFAEMIRMSLDRRYDGPVEGVTDVFTQMYEYGRLLIDPTIIGTLLIGGILAGIVTEVFGRSFR